MKEINHVDDVGVDERIILKLNFKIVWGRALD